MKMTQVRLANRVQDLEKVYVFNVDEYHALECYILVGEIKSEELAVLKNDALNGNAHDGAR